MRITVESFRAFAAGSIDLKNRAYREPLERGARALRDAVGPECEVVLLGSIASGKYVELLQPIFGEQLVFPPAFVGRGDMSRGGLMLRCVAAGLELEYAPIQGATRHGVRPPKLDPWRPVDAPAAMPVQPPAPEPGPPRRKQPVKTPAAAVSRRAGRTAGTAPRQGRKAGSKKSPK
jgi:hypothetical protein